MRIVHITPGTGSFYCGSCLRDNALVKALRAIGHEALMVPLYLPLILDEADASEGAPVFFGGPNVYLQQKLALFRRAPRWVNRLLDAPALLRFVARRAGMTEAGHLGDMAVSMVRGEEGRQARELDKLVEYLAQGDRPDVVCLSNALLIGMARRIRAEVGCAVVCTLQGEDSFLDGLGEPHRSEAWSVLRQRAADVDAFVAVSRYYADRMQPRLAVSDDRMHVIHNGIDVADYVPAEAPPDPPVLGYMTRLCPQKGLDRLVDAFVIIKQRRRVPGLKLRAAGAMTRDDRSFVQSMRDRLADRGLSDDAEFLPNISHEAKRAFLPTLSVMSVPAMYGEAFGIYVLEALASGVPVVQPRHGAFVELLELTGGGMLCQSAEPPALAETIETLLTEPAKAQRLGRTGCDAVRGRFTIERMARDMEALCQRLVPAAS